MRYKHKKTEITFSDLEMKVIQALRESDKSEHQIHELGIKINFKSFLAKCETAGILLHEDCIRSHAVYGISRDNENLTETNRTIIVR